MPAVIFRSRFVSSGESPPQQNSIPNQGPFLVHKLVKIARERKWRGVSRVREGRPKH